MKDVFTVTARDPVNQAAAEQVEYLLHALLEPHWPEWKQLCADLMIAEVFYGRGQRFATALMALEAKKDEIIADLTK